MATNLKSPTTRGCYLCGKKNTEYMTRFSSWGEEAKSFIARHSPPADAVICKWDHQEAKRNHGNLEYVPKWKNIKTKEISKCIYPTRSDKQVIIKTSFASRETIVEAIRVLPVIPKDLMLCKTHYNDLYRIINPPKKCSSCQSTCKWGNSFRHYSPDAITVSTYLQNRDTLYSPVDSHDLICLTCYKMHTSILESIEESYLDPDICLLSDIELWEQAQKDTHSTLTKAILATVINVGKHLLQNKALFLTSDGNIFLEAYGEEYSGSISSADVYIDTGDCTIQFSSRWFLNQLIIHLKNYMDFKCMHKKSYAQHISLLYGATHVHLMYILFYLLQKQVDGFLTKMVHTP